MMIMVVVVMVMIMVMIVGGGCGSRRTTVAISSILMMTTIQWPIGIRNWCGRGTASVGAIGHRSTIGWCRLDTGEQSTA